MLCTLLFALLVFAREATAVNQTFSIHDIFVIEINVATVTSQSAANYVAGDKSQVVTRAFSAAVGSEFYVEIFVNISEKPSFNRRSLLEERAEDDVYSNELKQILV